MADWFQLQNGHQPLGNQFAAVVVVTAAEPAIASIASVVGMHKDCQDCISARMISSIWNIMIKMQLQLYFLGLWALLGGFVVSARHPR